MTTTYSLVFYRWIPMRAHEVYLTELLEIEHMSALAELIPADLTRDSVMHLRMLDELCDQLLGRGLGQAVTCERLQQVSQRNVGDVAAATLVEDIEYGPEPSLCRATAQQGKPAEQRAPLHRTAVFR